jgi:hypothetical protein
MSESGTGDESVACMKETIRHDSDHIIGVQ